MSYVLKTEMVIGDTPGVLFFRGWAGKKSKHAEFTDKLRFAKHWKDRTNCKRFLKRNYEHLEKYQFVDQKIYKKRHCDFCGSLIDLEARSQTRFCSDLCRVKEFQSS